MAKNTSKESAAKFREMQQSVKDLTESLDKMIEKQGEMAAKSAAAAEAAEGKEKSRLERITERLTREMDGAKERAKTLQKEAAMAKDLAEKQEKLRELYDEQKEVLQKELEILQKKADISDEDKERMIEIGKQLKKNNQERKIEEKQLEKHKESLENINKLYDSYFSTLKKIGSGDFLGVVTDSFSKLGDVMLDLTKKGMKSLTKKAYQMSLNFGDMAKNFVGNNGIIGLLGESTQGFLATSSSMAASTAAAIGFGAALGTLLIAITAIVVAIGAAMIIAKFTLELENASRQVAKATGLTKDFSNAMFENATQMRTMGVTTEELSSAVTALNATFTDFSMLSTSTARRVAETTAVLGKLGMSADDTAKGFQTLTKGMAQTPEQAANTMVAMDALARDLGVSTSKIGADFSAAAGSLQKLSGPEAIQAFKQLSVVSKATGIEVSRLLAITEKFDTFDGAATQAGKLNAALGGNFVNAMELMTATNPVERFEMIRDSILDSGLAFDDMSYYQKKFFAEAAGMQDVSELALAMSGDFGAVGAEIGKTQADYEAAAERAKSFQSVQEQLKNSFYQLMPVITPLLEKLNEFTEVFTKFVENNKEEIQGVFESLGQVMMQMADTFIMLVPIMTPLMKLFMTLIQVALKLNSVFGFLAFSNNALKQSMTVRKSPSLLDAVGILGSGLSDIAESVTTILSPMAVLTGGMKKLKDSIFGDENGLTANVQMTAAGVAGIGDASAKTAATMRATAPTIANNTAIQNAANNTTINNNRQGGGETGISIKFDNKKFADLFDVQVEKSIGRAARKAVI